MPYIKRNRREDIFRNSVMDGKVVIVKEIKNPGELNYAVTEMIRAYWLASSQNYQAINDVVGALEGAKAEFQRRVVKLYENGKITDNGDVY